MITRRLLNVLLALALLVPVVTLLGGTYAIAAPQLTARPQISSQQVAASQPAISREEAIRQLAVVRASIDQTLELVKQGKIDQAYTQARTGYLDHFEYVEVPLRVVAPDLTADAETKFAEVRGLIKSGAPVATVRADIIDLRRMIDDTERRLTDTGFDAAAVVAGQSFLIIFREGLEAVLLLTALLGYLEATKSTRYRKPIVWGVVLGLAATALTYLILRSVLAVLPVGREVLEAVVATAAVAVLLYISFWLIARLEHRRWMEFLRSRVFNAVSAGSTTALVLVGFTAMYREGLETALLYQALVEFGQGLGWWVVAGLAAGLVALAVVSYLIFKLGRRLPVKTFLVGAVLLLMATSVAFLGNAVRSLQTADLVGLTPLARLPRLPIFLSQALGYWPSVQTVASQAALVAVYALGAMWLLLVRPPARGRAADVGVRVGADVGGTFTKAVALDSVTGELAGRAVVPTTHGHRDGVSAGVVDVVAKLVAEVGAEAIELVTHSTTQAVNALLEGDTVPVGVLGLGRAPYLRKARKRTMVSGMVAHEFLDLTSGFDAGLARQALARLADAGAQALCVAEAFAPDDSACEDAVAVLAAELGLPVTTSSGLTGLYGLELRTVTAALNASILPIALRTAEVVEAGVAAAGVTCPVMVMRGDGGATDLAGFRAAPARTLYSGPAASVAGALRTLRIGDGVIVEVGGTSTNVAAITGGRPALSYVRVAGQATAVRALDVQVAGVAGGSMLRVRRRRIYGVGPRSAHIAGLIYSCFLAPERLVGARAETLAPKPGDPADYLVLRLVDGVVAALTNTCAANALGLVPDGDYAAGHRGSATAALDVAGQELGLPGTELARRMMQASTEALADLVTTVAAQHHLTQPTLIAVGGGASVLGRPLAGTLGLDCEIPPGAEVISSMGDALSLVRAERERTVSRATPADIDALIAEVEAEALAAGASPTSLQVQVSQISDRGAIRAVAVGALVLGSGVVPGRPPLSREAIVDVARAVGGSDQVDPVGRFWLSSLDGRVLLLDRFGDVALDVRGEAILLDGSSGGLWEATIESVVSRHIRHVGPITVQPTAWVVQDGRIRELANPDAIADTVGAGAAAVIVEAVLIMALYTPQTQRRQRLLILAVAAFVLGCVLGGLVGRFTAPTPADRVADVREQARQTSSQLRVLSLHVEAGAASLGAGGDAGAALALHRADDDLTRALEQAPWITAERQNALRARLHSLEQAASSGAATKPFAADVDRLAGDIDTTFGLTSAAP